MRYVTLLVGLTLVFSGCLASPGGPGTVTLSESPTETSPAQTTTETSVDESTARETNTPTPECKEESMTTVNPERTAVTPNPLPDRPHKLDTSSVQSFAEAYERAYKRNTGLETDTERYDVSIYDSTVREVDGGYVVNITAVFWYNAASVVNGTTTPTVVHADGPQYDVAYFITDDRVRRDSSLEDDPLTPHQGPIVECWETEA